MRLPTRCNPTTPAAVESSPTLSTSANPDKIVLPVHDRATTSITPPPIFIAPPPGFETRSVRPAALGCSWPTAIPHDALNITSAAPVFAAEETTFARTKNPAIVYHGGLATEATQPPLPTEYASACNLSSSLPTPVMTAVMRDQHSLPRARLVNQRQTVVQPDGMPTECPKDLAVHRTSDCVSPRPTEEISSLCAQPGYNLVLPLPPCSRCSLFI